MKVKLPRKFARVRLLVLKLPVFTVQRFLLIILLLSHHIVPEMQKTPQTHKNVCFVNMFKLIEGDQKSPKIGL